MKEKLLQLMKSEGLTSSRLAEILEIQPSGISHPLRTQQTWIRFATKDSQKVPACQSGLAPVGLFSDVPPRFGATFKFQCRHNFWQQSLSTDHRGGRLSRG